MSNPIEEVTVTFEINKNNGKIKLAKGSKGGPVQDGPVAADITDSIGVVVSKNSPACVWYLIGGQWYKFCSP